MITAGPPQAVTAIMSRITSLASEPTAVERLRTRFDSLLGAQAATSVDASAETGGSQVSTISSSLMSGPNTAIGGVGVLEAPRIVRRVDSPAGNTMLVPSGVMPTGTWVDRIPNARGKALAPTIAAAAQRYGVEPAFLAAVFWTESSYTPDAVSRTGAIGLGQLMPETASWLGVDPWDPAQNIDGSARFYRYLIDRNNGDMSLAIASYAAGPGAVKQAGGIPDQFTANYVTKLLARTDYLAGRRSTPP